MSLDETFKIATAVIVALGGGGALVLALSSWLGKVWADRLMADHSARHQRALTELQEDLRRRVGIELANNKTNLEIFREKHLKGHNDKITFYRLATDVIVEVLGDLDYFHTHGAPLQDGAKRFDAINRGRMRAYAYLAMLAPQEVMNALDNLFDYLMQVIHGQETYHWPTVRVHVLSLLNEIRKDIGVDTTPISYFGKL